MSEASSFSLRGKVIIQFGGTGLLGRALVSELASTGCTLIVASRNRAALQSLADKERAAGRTVLIEETDIGTKPRSSGGVSSDGNWVKTTAAAPAKSTEATTTTMGAASAALSSRA